MAGVQFYGIDKVLAMYDARAVDAWSIFHGKEFQFKGHGDGELRSVLESLKNSFNDPIYTLKVYEGFDSADKIKNNTPHDGSFNFKINVPMEVQGMGYVSGNSNFELIKRIQQLEEQNKLLMETDVDDEEPETIGSVVDAAIIEIVKDPGKAMTWLDVIKGIFNPGYQAPARPHAALPASIGNINPGSETPVIDLSMEQKLERLEKALDKLEKADPKIVEHLEKLADLATKNQGQFKFLLTMLDTMK